MYFRIQLLKGSFCGRRPPCWLTRTGSMHDYGFCGTDSIRRALIISKKALYAPMLQHFLIGKEYDFFEADNDINSLKIMNVIDSPDDFGGESYMHFVQYRHMVMYKQKLPYVYMWEILLPEYDPDAIIRECSSN